MLSIIIDLIKSGISLFTKNKTEVAKSKDELETEKTSEAQETNKMQRAKGELVEAGEKEQKHQEREYQKREEKEL